MVLSSIFAKEIIHQTGGAPNIVSLVIKNRAFLAKIFANLFAQLGITYYVMENSSIPENRLMNFIGSLILLFVIAGTNLPYWVKLILFVGFSYLIGKNYTIYKKKYGEEVIRNSILGAMGVFAIMFIVGGLLPILGEKVGIVLFFALLSLLMARITAMFTDKTDKYKKVLSGIGIIIFALYVAYDTNNILKRANYYQGDFVTASMDYYLDIINLFSNMNRSQ
jgi:FtsH-binding integral membrane protein